MVILGNFNTFKRFVFQLAFVFEQHDPFLFIVYDPQITYYAFVRICLKSPFSKNYQLVLIISIIE